MLAVDHIYPAVQFLAGVMVAQMQVAHHHQRQGFSQRFVCRQRHLHAYLIIIMYVAIQEECEHAQCQGYRGIEVLTEPCLGYQVHQASDVEHQEYHDQIEQDEDARVAYVINQASQPQWQTVDDTGEIKENHAERQHAYPNDDGAPHRRQRHERPHMPAYVGQSRQGQQ